MDKALEQLEEMRGNLYRQMASLGDFRPGTISVNFRKCGRKNCACARPDHPGHGPQYLWNTTQNGRSRSQNLRIGPELEKVGQEVESYKEFRRLCHEAVRINEEICHKRPVPEVEDQSELKTLKKKIAEEVCQEAKKEIDRLIGRVFGDKERQGHVDMESTELAIRHSMHQVGGVLLEKLINADTGGYRGVRIDCGSGHEAEFVGYRTKGVTTVLSPLKVQRACYHCRECKRCVIPKDRELDIEGTSFSPGVRRMMARVGAKESFEDGRCDLEGLAGIRVVAKEVERISEDIGVRIEMTHARERCAVLEDRVIPMAPAVSTLYIAIDGTGVPVVPSETEGHKGKDETGIARTREAKLGAVFTQTTVDEKGYAVRDEASTTYVGAIETAEEFGKRTYAEAVRRGLNRAGKVVILGDGAVWIRNIAEEHFSQATQIVDLYHSLGHLSDLAKLLYGPTGDIVACWNKAQSTELKEGDVENVIAAMKRLKPRSASVREAVATTLGYFETNRERMRYADFRNHGLFVGSGVIEAGCKKIVGQRLKHSGMRWTVYGANSIIALRCCQISGRWEEFWENRATG